VTQFPNTGGAPPGKPFDLIVLTVALALVAAGSGFVVYSRRQHR